MIFFCLLIIAIVIKGAKLSGLNQFNTEYLSIENCNNIKGIFLLIIIVNHASQYLTLSTDNFYDNGWLVFIKFLGQMVVSMFMFYSGYGIMESIAKKKRKYILSMPYKRVFKTFINFDIALVFYLILNIIFKIKYPVSTYLQAMVGFKTIGNSNWYIFAILVLYALSFIAFLPSAVSDKGWVKVLSASLLTVFTIAVVYIEMKCKVDSWYYNTMILYPLGVWYSIAKKYINKIVMKNDVCYFGFLSVLVVLAAVAKLNIHKLGIKSYSLWAIAFTLLIVMLSMKISIKSTILEWVGKNIFGFFILQRLPMIVLSKLGLATVNKYWYLVIVIVVTVFITYLFDYLLKFIKKYLKFIP